MRLGIGVTVSFLSRKGMGTYVDQFAVQGIPRGGGCHVGGDLIGYRSVVVGGVWRRNDVVMVNSQNAINCRSRDPNPGYPSLRGPSTSVNVVTIDPRSCLSSKAITKRNDIKYKTPSTKPPPSTFRLLSTRSPRRSFSLLRKKQEGESAFLGLKVGLKVGDFRFVGGKMVADFR
jgi:hypothetical protein